MGTTWCLLSSCHCQGRLDAAFHVHDGELHRLAIVNPTAVTGLNVNHS